MDRHINDMESYAMEMLVVSDTLMLLGHEQTKNKRCKMGIKIQMIWNHETAKDVLCTIFQANLWYLILQ